MKHVIDVEMTCKFPHVIARFCISICVPEWELKMLVLGCVCYLWSRVWTAHEMWILTSIVFWVYVSLKIPKNQPLPRKKWGYRCLPITSPRSCKSVNFVHWVQHFYVSLKVHVKLEYVSNTFTHIYKESKKGQIETASGL